jgi:tetratricopeptide (TPR) repeat protein
LAPPAAPAPPPVKARETGADGKALRAEADRLLAEGNVVPGIQKLREATEADPTPRNHGDLGDLLARLTAFDEALVHLRQAAELDPGNADRWIALANAYYRAVNPGEAWKAEKRAKEAEPGLVLGRDEFGRRVRQGDSAPRKP